jgi:RNA polymerase sigma-70 factor (ECF subfamily)
MNRPRDQSNLHQDQLEALYREHRQGLYTLALSVTRCPDRAEDAVQQAFVRLYKRKSRSVGDPAAYVFMAVRNAAIDQIRKRKRDQRTASCIYDEALGAPAGADGPGPETAALRNERQRAVRDAVERLEDQQREVIVMKVYGGLTFEQIGQVLGAPLSTVASRYRRGLVKLEGRLSKWT